MGIENYVVLFSDAKGALAVYRVKSGDVSFQYFPCKCWLVSIFLFLPIISGECCGVFRGLNFHAAFMLIIS